MKNRIMIMDEIIYRKATPESAGVSSRCISSALRSLNRDGVMMHSLLVLRGKSLITEAYWKPWKRDSLHRMYSVTKSFVSLAIGCLIDEGKIRLDDRIVSYFPEYLPSPVPEELAEMTIRDMLMMRTCHRRTAYKEGSSNWNYVPSYSDNWVRAFFQVPPDHDPGAFFIYDTSSPQALAGLVEKLTGMKTLDYLRSKFLDSLKVSKDAYIPAEPAGVSMGGCGLMMRPIDLLAVMDLVKDGGRGFISSDYLKEATSALSETEIGSSGDYADQKAGYGYQFWRLSHDAYAMLGMGAQYAIAIPDKDMVIVTTADTQADKPSEKLILSAIWSIVDNATGSSLPEDKDSYDDLLSLEGSLEIPVSKGVYRSDVASRLDGREAEFKSNNLALETVRFSLSPEKGRVSCLMGGKEYTFTFGYGRNIKNEFPVSVLSPCYVSGGIMRDGTLSVFVQFSGEELGTLKLQFAERNGRIDVLMHQYGELSVIGFEGIASGRLK